MIPGPSAFRVAVASALAALAIALPAAAQAPESQPAVEISDDEYRDQVEMQFGMVKMLTPDLAKLALNSALPQIARDLGVPAEKREELRKAMLDRLEPFLKSHQETFTRLAEQLRDALLANEPPGPAVVDPWAADLKALVGDFNTQVEGFIAEITPYADPAKIEKLRADLKRGMGEFDTKLADLSDPEKVRAEWERQRGDIRRQIERRKGMRGRRSAASQPAEAAPAPVVSAAGGAAVAAAPADPDRPPGDWMAAVEQFIAANNLDAAQAGSARGIGSDVLARRERLWMSNAELLKRARTALQDYSPARKPAEELNALRQERNAFYARDDALFAEMMARLEKLR